MKKYNIEFIRDVVNIEYVKASVEIEDEIIDGKEIIDHFYLAIEKNNYTTLEKEIISENNVVEGSEEIISIKNSKCNFNKFNKDYKK